MWRTWSAASCVGFVLAVAGGGCDPSTCTAECRPGDVLDCGLFMKTICGEIDDQGCNATHQEVPCDSDDCSLDLDCNAYAASG